MPEDLEQDAVGQAVAEWPPEESVEGETPKPSRSSSLFSTRRINIVAAILGLATIWVFLLLAERAASTAKSGGDTQDRLAPAPPRTTEP